MKTNNHNFDFNTGVRINLNNGIITANSEDGYYSSFDIKNFDNISYEQTAISKLTGWAIYARFTLLIAVIFSIGYNKQNVFLTGLGLFLFIVFSILFLLESYFESNLIFSFLSNYFSKKGYRVSIGNKSGNNIDFFTDLDELHKIKKLEKKISELNNLIKNTLNVKGSQKAPSHFDELRTLAELHKDGIISEDEYKKKKSEILNLKYK